MWQQWYEPGEEVLPVIPPPDLSRVAVDDAYEVRRWCQRFVCTEEQLKRAVRAAGSNPTAVRAQLKRFDLERPERTRR
jgi:hypothetical protein